MKKKLYKKIFASTMATVLAMATIISATAETGFEPNPDMVFAPMINFDNIDNGVYNFGSPGMPTQDEYMDAMYKTDSGEFLISDSVGANESRALTFKNKKGNSNEGVWTRLQFKPAYEADNATFIPSTIKYDVIGQATDFYFWIDASKYNVYPVEKDPEDDSIVIGRTEETPSPSAFYPQLFIYDKGTSANEGLTAYSPKKGEPLYIQDYENGGWTSKKCPSNSFIVPAGYVGYVRIPRTSFEAVYGTTGDILANGDTPAAGDNMFNGPIEFIALETMSGGLALEGAEVTFDDFGFLSYEFAEGIESVTIPVHEKKVEIIKGDVTGDKEVTTLDVLVILKHIAKLTVLEGDNLVAADYDSNGPVNTFDALGILKMLAKVE